MITSVEDVTANLVVMALNEHRGVQVARIDPADIGDALVFGTHMGAGLGRWSGRLRTPSRDVALDQVGAVYYRRPTPFSTRFAHLPEREREFAVTEAWHGLGGVLYNLHGTAYVNHPAAITRADFKPAQLQMAAQLGMTVPRTLITNDVSQAREFAADGPIIYKSFRGVPPAPDGRVTAIWTQSVAEHELDDSISVTAHMFQTEVCKEADARVTVIGRRVFAYRITSPDGALDWRQGDWDALVHEPIDVPRLIEGALHAYLDSFGLVFGCFDFAIEAETGRWVFIECNPNGQWAWLPGASEMAQAFADEILEGWWP
ncbi:ATP-grasp ribosomal peptide maturase [Nonomuraea lactucae]|uniref:ATP-grasp ribosomal peptide maturase n=1 Tax=Nonomuraea lactucae TaxID=2249762 RepID=UPI001F06B231|nr:ATP-grasp ribosomal peptide maturase [Nonomuraea lactucae]